MLYQALIDAELTATIGAAPHERTATRTAQRNGSRPRTLATTAGDLELRIQKLRAGSFFPSLLERRRRIAPRASGPARPGRGRGDVPRGGGSPGH